MIAFFNSLVLALAAGGSRWEAFKHFYNDWFNIPGFELWKFINLFVFVYILVRILKKPLSEAFKAKREQIRAELIKAEQERKAAMERLTAVEARLAQLENEKEQILARAREEAEEAKRRMAEQTAADIERLKRQAESELERLAAQLRAGLRRFSAEESIRRATEKLRGRIDDSVDARLVKASISEIGGLN
jgi:F-type H+-transporting ATPase subunit b